MVIKKKKVITPGTKEYFDSFKQQPPIQSQPTRVPENSPARDPNTGAIIQPNPFSFGGGQASGKGAGVDAVNKSYTGSSQTDVVKTKSTQPTFLTDAESGKIKGLQYPDGRVIFTSPTEAKAQYDIFMGSRTIPQGAQTTEQVGAINNQQRLVQEAMQNIGQEPNLQGGLEQADILPAAVGGSVGALKGAASTAITGAGIGAAAGSIIPGAGTIAGGIIGGGIGAVVGFVSNLKGEVSGEFKQAVGTNYATFTGAKQNIAKEIAAINRGANISPMDAVEYYNLQWAKMRQVKRWLEEQTRNDVTKYLGDPGDQLARANEIFAQKAIIDSNFYQALSQPNPIYTDGGIFEETINYE